MDGSKLNFSNTNGIQVPINAATKIEANIPNPIIPPSTMLPSHRLTIPNTTTLEINPIPRPVVPLARSTFQKIVLPHEDQSYESLTASDCVPVFPAVPVISVIKWQNTCLLNQRLIMSERNAVTVPIMRRVIIPGKRLNNPAHTPWCASSTFTRQDLNSRLSLLLR